jgi:hypothetical protein
MATTSGPSIQYRKVLFVRVGWMHFYSGPVAGDERPIGGGKFNQTAIGGEVYNFRETDGRLYGYFQPVTAANTVALERIDPVATHEDALNQVLVVFVARRPEGGQVIVGWYKDAVVFRENVDHSPGKPQGYGHFCSAERGNCTLLPEENRRLEIPSGKGGMGQSNVCYLRNRDGSQKQAPWIQAALDFIDDYQTSNILATPEAAAERESAAVAEQALA